MTGALARAVDERLLEGLARLRGEYYRIRLGWLSAGRIEIGGGLRAFGPLEVRGAGRVVIGRDVTLHRDPFHKEKVRLHLGGGLEAESLQPEIRIGDRATLCGSQVRACKQVRIGAGAWVEDALLLDSDFHEPRGDPAVGHCPVDAAAAGAATPEPAAAAAVVIGEDAVVGTGALVLRGAVVAQGATVRPGSVVCG
jgi:carbonic anhydrase/acetyltransferase-like protein (isoleucine patch superfamily)